MYKNITLQKLMATETPVIAKDALNGDHSFKMWWSVMATDNQFAYIFIAAFIAMIGELIKLSSIKAAIIGAFADGALGGILTCLGCSVPLLVFVAVGIEMMIYWKQLCQPII